MRTRRITKSKYKNLKGIVIPEAARSTEDLALLTPDGQTIPILKNEKFNFLKNLIWESVTVFGKIVKQSQREYLEVIFFTSSSPTNLFDYQDFDLTQEGTRTA